ncbi:MAG: hypothetical protein FGM24_07315 [Candidatus Kapabacteria bacterium]|nr:hypothetical protein [Candidatus Kapabacteria bacterium]
MKTLRHLAVIVGMFAAGHVASACISCVHKNIGAAMNELALHATHLPAKVVVHAAPTPGSQKHATTGAAAVRPKAAATVSNKRSATRTVPTTK